MQYQTQIETVTIKGMAPEISAHPGYIGLAGHLERRWRV